MSNVIGGVLKRRSVSLGLTLSVLTVLQIVVAFGFQGYLMVRLGAGIHADGFYAGNTLSQIVSGLIIDTLPMVLVPAFAACDDREVDGHGWLLCGIATIGLLILAWLLSAAAGVVMPLLVPGFSREAKDITVAMTRIQLYGMVGTACTAILSAVYQTRERFVWPALAILISALAGWLMVMWTLGSWGVTAAAWAQVLTVTGPALLMLPGLRSWRQARWRIGIVSELWSRLRPIVLARFYFMTSAPIDRILVSFLPAGSLVSFELVSRFYGGVQRVLNQGVLSHGWPRLSRLAQADDWRAFRSLYVKQVKVIFALSIAVVIGVEACAIGALYLLPVADGQILGKLSVSDLQRIAWLLVLVSGMLPCVTATTALNRAYYAQGDTSTPTRISVIAYTAGVPMKAIGVFLGGISGLALAVTVWVAFYCGWLYIALGRHTSRMIHTEPAGRVAVVA